MKTEKLILIVIILLSSITCFCQEITERLQEKTSIDSAYTKVNVMPMYPDGGVNGFSEFIAQNFKTKRIKKDIKGTLYIQFVVEADGSLSEVKCIRDLGYGSCEEAIRVIKKSRKWIPGHQNNKPVRVTYTLPINLNITSN